MAEHDGQGHELFGLFAGVTEHHALIARALFVYTLGDIRALLVERHHDGTAFGVETHLAGGITDVADGPADDLGDIDIGRGGDFAGDNDQAGRNKGLASDA